MPEIASTSRFKGLVGGAMFASFLRPNVAWETEEMLSEARVDHWTPYMRGSCDDGRVGHDDD